LKINFKHITVLGLTMLILTSTIGVNFVTSLCMGCNSESKLIALTTPDLSECLCCEHQTDEAICCNLPLACAEENHETKSHFAKLLIDYMDSSQKVSLVLHTIVITTDTENQFESNIALSNNKLFQFNNLPPPKSGRNILSANCILRI
jgi:hypothetical protein